MFGLLPRGPGVFNAEAVSKAHHLRVLLRTSDERGAASGERLRNEWFECLNACLRAVRFECLKRGTKNRWRLYNYARHDGVITRNRARIFRLRPAGYGGRREIRASEGRERVITEPDILLIIFHDLY